MSSRWTDSMFITFITLTSVSGSAACHCRRWTRTTESSCRQTLTTSVINLRSIFAGIVNLLPARCYASAALAGLWPCVYVCLCPSQVGVLSIYWWTDRARFPVWIPSTYPTSCYEENPSICKSKDTCTSLWNFVLNAGLTKFYQSTSVVAHLRPLSVIIWTVVGQLRWQYLRRSTL